MKRNINIGRLIWNNGRTSVETLAVMLLLILLGVGLFCLCFSSVNLYQRQYADKSVVQELRVAASFVVNRIRQNDVSGNIKVMPDSISGKNALVIQEEIEGQRYATWIFHYEGFIYEALVLVHELPSIELSQPIAQAETFEINYYAEDGGIQLIVKDNSSKTYETFVKLRSEVG